MTQRARLKRNQVMWSLLVAAGAASSAAADDSARYLLIDRMLQAKAVTLSGIENAIIRVKDEQGAEREIAAKDVIGLAPSWWRPAPTKEEASALASAVNLNALDAAGMLVLTDGRRVKGGLAKDGGKEEVRWEHVILGVSGYSLDDVRRMQMSSGLAAAKQAANAPRASGDRVVMVNGDVVTGFVESLGDPVKIESDGKIVDLSPLQVLSVELANPSKAAKGGRVWLVDGSVVDATNLAADDGEGSITFGFKMAGVDGASSISGENVVAVVFDAAKVMPLASLPIASQKGVGERRHVDPVALRWRGEQLDASWRDHAGAMFAAPFDAPDIELPGPMSVEWMLPAGATRFAGWAELPQESRLWGEFTLTIEGVGGMGGVASEGKIAALLSEAMNGTKPVVEFNIELPQPAPERLRISMDPGVRGPIQDRVLLRRALVLMEPGTP